MGNLALRNCCARKEMYSDLVHHHELDAKLCDRITINDFEAITISGSVYLGKLPHLEIVFSLLIRDIMTFM